jgi:tRNA threonylcarbamoyladenosine biosynthesis protein TsaE
MPVHVTVTHAVDLAAFGAAAAAFAATLRAGDVVALSGDLGAGKTTFVAAVVRALHGTDAATSPTFTFWHRYDGPPLVNHLDLYRVEGPADLATLGLDDAFTDDAIVLVEWPENGPGLLPQNAVRVAIAGAGDTPRTIEIARP